MQNNTDVLIYDDNCPLCAAYTKAFVAGGLLAPAGRQKFSAVPENILALLDVELAHDQIPLLKTDGTILYGVDAMLNILGGKMPVVETIGKLKPVNYLLKKAYKLISYNRKVVVAHTPASNAYNCSPQFNTFYRICFITLIGIACFGIFKMLATTNALNLSAQQLSVITYLLGGYVTVNLLAGFAMPKIMRLEFYGQIAMHSLLTCFWLLLLGFSSSALWLYAAVAVCGFLSINSYKQRLRFVRFTTNKT